MFLGVPIFKHIIIRLQCAQILGHLKINNLMLGTNGKFIILGVPILRHIMVIQHWDLKLLPELQIRGSYEDNSKIIFSYFSPKTYVVTLIRTVSMRRF